MPSGSGEGQASAPAGIKHNGKTPVNKKTKAAFAAKSPAHAKALKSAEAYARRKAKTSGKGIGAAAKSALQKAAAKAATRKSK